MKRSVRRKLKLRNVLRELFDEVSEVSDSAGKDFYDVICQVESSICEDAVASVPDILRLPNDLHRAALEQLLYEADTTRDFEEDDPAAFCCDWHAEELGELSDDEVLVLLRSGASSAEDIAQWLEMRDTKRQEQAAFENVEKTGRLPV